MVVMQASPVVDPGRPASIVNEFMSIAAPQADTVAVLIDLQPTHP
jgi:hypothetical protein